MTIDKSPAAIARDIRTAAELMLDIATDLDYHGGLNGQWQAMARWFLVVSAGANHCAGKLDSSTGSLTCLKGLTKLHSKNEQNTT